MAKRSPPLDLRLESLMDEVRKLRQELWLVRHNLVGLMPSKLEQLLSSYYALPEGEEPYNWQDALVEKLLEHASPRPRLEMGGVSSYSDRAICPLCGGSSDNPHGEEGFAYPEGLRRHLAGSYNARQCVVTKAAIELAWDHYREEKRRKGT